MAKNKDNFSAAELKKLAESDAGRQLLAMLQGSEAEKLARSGRMEDAQKAIGAFLTDPKAEALLKRLEEQSHG